jgi:hypothetical protein
VLASAKDNDPQFLHYIGACSNNCKIPNITKSKSDSIGLFQLKMTGFVPPFIIAKILNQILDLKIKSEWCSLLVTGFEDSVVSWGEEQHGLEISGENDYSFIIYPNSSYVLYEILGQNDEHS